MEASQPGRILLIDDDPALGGYLTRVRTRGGFAVAHELDSASALLTGSAAHWPPRVTARPVSLAEQPGLRRLEFRRAQHARLAQLGQVIELAHQVIARRACPDGRIPLRRPLGGRGFPDGRLRPRPARRSSRRTR